MTFVLVLLFKYGVSTRHRSAAAWPHGSTQQARVLPCRARPVPSPPPQPARATSQPSPSRATLPPPFALLQCVRVIYAYMGLAGFSIFFVLAGIIALELLQVLTCMIRTRRGVCCCRRVLPCQALRVQQARGRAGAADVRLCCAHVAAGSRQPRGWANVAWKLGRPPPDHVRPSRAYPVGHPSRCSTGMSTWTSYPSHTSYSTLRWVGGWAGCWQLGWSGRHGMARPSVACGQWRGVACSVRRRRRRVPAVSEMPFSPAFFPSPVPDGGIVDAVLHAGAAADEAVLPDHHRWAADGRPESLLGA